MAYTDMERRILDMWPKFEDGSYVQLGDSYIDTDIDENEVMAIEFNDCCADLIGVEGYRTGFEPFERVKRPAPKVLDADGVEIKVGDTVYGVGRSQHSFDVIDPHHIDPEVGETFSVRCYDRDEHEECHCKPKLLTHVQPDSWERLEKDAKKGNCEYLGRSQSSCDGCYLNGKSACDEYVRIDLIRRAKALAEKEAER